MYDLIFTFLQQRVFGTSLIAFIQTSVQQTNGSYLNLRDYLCMLGALIIMIFIFVLCCLFVWKIVKLIGGLIYR